jgi:hypothetical protein
LICHFNFKTKYTAACCSGAPLQFQSEIFLIPFHNPSAKFRHPPHYSKIIPYILALTAILEVRSAKTTTDTDIHSFQGPDPKELGRRHGQRPAGKQREGSNMREDCKREQYSPLRFERIMGEG